MLKIAFVTHQHDNDIGLGVVLELLEPALDVLKGAALGDIVDEQRADGAPIVRRCDGAVALLAGGIPYLRLDGLPVGLDGASGKLDANRALRLEIELVPRESAQQIRLAAWLARQRAANGGGGWTALTRRRRRR